MNNFEGLPKEELGVFEGGPQVGVEQQIESPVDEELVLAMDRMKDNGHYRIPDVINRLGDNKKATREELSKVINIFAGYSWETLNNIVTDAESEKALSDMIVSWSQEVELAADNDAIRKADEALAQKLEAF